MMETAEMRMASLHHANYFFAKNEIRKAWENDNCVWTKLRQLYQFLSLNKVEYALLVDYCHDLLED